MADREAAAHPAGGLRRVARYAGLYGPLRTYFKVASHARRRRVPMPFPDARVRDVAIVGCGQFAFATIGYFLARPYGNRIADCFDVDPDRQASFARFYRVATPSTSFEEMIAREDVRYLFIASNHASHAEYAAAGLDAGKHVHVEKPVAVDRDQLASLQQAVRRRRSGIAAGFCRPFAPLLRALRSHCADESGPVTLGFFVNSMVIPEDHWYRRPGEGTRVCGNLGHWLDLAVHVLSWSTLVDEWDVAVSWSDGDRPDDDLSVTLTSERGDLVSLVSTSRAAPFEGVSESVHFQQGRVIARLDDWRRLDVWKGASARRYRRIYKDVGHRACLQQLFSERSRPPSRDWSEVERSTALTLHLTDMVVSRRRQMRFSFAEERGVSGPLGTEPV